jgi:soluble lytic murein transglycosylase
LNEQKKAQLKLIGIVISIVLVLSIVLYNCVILTAQTLYPKKYSDLVEKVAAELQVEPILLYALIETESGFDKNAVSDAGAMGLTQITSETFQWLQTKTKTSYSDEDLFKPEISIYFGGFFIKLLLEEFEHVDVVFAAYHAGRGQVNEWLSDPRYSPDGETLETIPFKDTANYVEKINKNIKNYNNIYDMGYDYEKDI